MAWPGLFLVLTGLAIVTRAQHIRRLVVPAWVDPVHHTAIARLLIEQGNVPDTFHPFIPGGEFVYHWGYHAVVAWLAWISGLTEPLQITRLMLHFGQWLNVITLLMVYVAGRSLFGSRSAGLFAAVLAVFVSWFPAYYVSWGRYTHLAGLLVMPIFLLELWRLRDQRSAGLATRVILLGTGLFLIHVRITLFAVAFCGTLAILLLANRRWQSLARWALCGVAVLLVSAPWLWEIMSSGQLSGALVSQSESSDGWWRVYNAIPWSLVWIPYNSELLSLATGGLSGLAGWGDAPLLLRIVSGAWLVLLLAISATRRIRLVERSTFGRPWAPIGVIAGWCVMTMLLLNLGELGLPALTFVTNGSAVILLFLPLSLAGGGLLAWCTDCLAPRSWATAVTMAAALAISLFGATNMVDVVNRDTVLVYDEDLEAIEWIRENTNTDAVFLVGAQRWQGETYVGTDAGYWISVLADRQTTVPPALYAQSSPPDTVATINGLLAAVADAETIGDTLDDPLLRQMLRVANVSHIYVGQRYGRAVAPSLTQRDDVRLVYQRDAVYVFELLRHPG